MGWELVITFGRAFAGEMITREHGRTRISMPFADERSAREALGEMTVTVERAKPDMIQGEVVPDVPAITAGEVTG